jgi:hypothetical protein
MKFKATPVSAFLAGNFSAITWPFLWPLFHDASPSASLWLVVGVLGLIAVPAHVFVLGLNRTPADRARGLDLPLLKRIGAWLVGGGLGALVLALK